MKDKKAAKKLIKLAKEHPEKCRKITAAAEECEDLDRAIADVVENYGLLTWHPAGQGGD